MASKKPFSPEEIRPKVLLLGIYAPYNTEMSSEDYFEEFLSLVKTAEISYDETVFINLREIDKGYFLTKGKRSDILKICQDNNIEEVICSELLTPLQERNLEDLFGCTVVDREQLILEIFRKSAHTAEGKIQVEMAQLEYLKTRISGKGAQLAQQEGHIGSRGPGETSKEVVKRHIMEKTRQATKRLENLTKSRDVQRKQRLASKEPLICLIGYTNAGKSSILNLLTKSTVLSEDKLFATLDITTRELYIGHKKIGLISDTVGFISHLPHHLIKAFTSTLDELKYADLLLHVVDTSNHSWQGQIEIVLQTLEKIGVKNKKMLYVFNKIDSLSEEEINIVNKQIGGYEPHVKTHALNKEGLEPLVKYLQKQNFKQQKKN